MTSWAMHSISCKIMYVPSECSDQTAHPRSLIRVFAGHSLSRQWSKTCSGGQRRLWSAWADVHADWCLHWAHMQSCELYPGSFVTFSYSIWRNKSSTWLGDNWNTANWWSRPPCYFKTLCYEKPRPIAQTFWSFCNSCWLVSHSIIYQNLNKLRGHIADSHYLKH